MCEGNVHQDHIYVSAYYVHCSQVSGGEYFQNAFGNVMGFDVISRGGGLDLCISWTALIIILWPLRSQGCRFGFIHKPAG